MSKKELRILLALPSFLFSLFSFLLYCLTETFLSAAPAASARTIRAACYLLAVPKMRIFPGTLTLMHYAYCIT